MAGVIDEMGLLEQVNQRLGQHPLQVISPGQAVKAMILNGLGFVSAPLYLFEQFFVGKATEHLIGEGIQPEHLNDDRMGRVLDQLYEAGLTEMFIKVALRAAKRFGVLATGVPLPQRSVIFYNRQLETDCEFNRGTQADSPLLGSRLPKCYLLV